MFRGVIYSYKINDKYYVGKTLMQERKRIGKHKYEALTKKSDTPFARAIRKYGWSNVVKTYSVIEEIYAETKKELNVLLCQKETYWIGKMNSVAPNGYNVYRKGQISTPYVSDKNKMYEKISKSLKGKHLNNSETSKPVFCIETKTWYPSSMEVERQLGINHDSIGRCIKGKICKAGGYTWSLSDKDISRESKLHKNQIICVEDGTIYESMRDVARQICEEFEIDELDHVYSNVKASVKNGWACHGKHYKKTGKIIPCYQTKNQYGKIGSVTTIP